MCQNCYLIARRRLCGVTLAILVWLGSISFSEASAQSTFGSILGTLSDGTGAVVPGVRVTVTNLVTNERRSTATSTAGLYQFANLLPASYRLEAEMSGFKRFVREPVLLEVQQTVRIDIKMALGEVSETVEVTDATPLLQPETSSLGEVIQRRKVEDLPLSGRNTLALAALVPGVVPQGSSTDAPAVPNFFAWGNFQISGALGNQSEAMLDGATVMGSLMNSVRFVPTQDSIQEFKVQTNNLSAEYGRTSGGIINLTTKSGSNQLHGSLFEFLRNEVLDANTFFNNANRVKTPAFTQNQFGGTVGGPVLRNKLFYFGSYEGFRQRRGRSFLLTVPTLPERSGDFSQTRSANGNLIPIHDALTTTTLPDGTATRTPFPNSVIPQSRLDAAARRLANLAYAPPNLPGAPNTNINNWAGNTAMAADADQAMIRSDYLVSDNDRFFGRYSYWRADTPRLDPFENNTQVVLDIFPDFRETQQLMVEDVHSFSPSTVADFRYTHLWFQYDRIPLSQGQDMTALGFAPNLNREIPADFRHIPNLTVAGMTLIFPGSKIHQAERTQQFTANVTKIWDRHTLKVGTDLRIYRQNYTQTNDSAGAFTFNAPFTARSPFTTSGGTGFASFMLGYAATGAANTPALQEQSRFYRAVYVQDDFRATTKLTLNLGLRYDQDGDFTERNDRFSTFNPGLPHPLTQATGLPLKGRVILVNTPEHPSRQWKGTYLGQVAPRFGFAYRLANRTVLRGGYGLFWLPPTIARRETLVEPTAVATTTFVGSIDGGLRPFHTLANPFPDGIRQPPGRARDLEAIFAGQTFPSTLREKEYAYSQQWNFNLQREWGGSTLVEVAYAGLKGNRLPINLFGINQLSAEALAQGPSLNTLVPNPFAGLVSRGPLSTPTIARGRLLRPFPQYDTVGIRGLFAGNSIYHSLQAKFQKRFSSGAGILVSYTNAKLISDTETQTSWLDAVANAQDAYNFRAERAVSSSDVPQRLVVSGNYDLPFGRGKQYLGSSSGLTGAVVSGWAVNGIYTWQAGFPLGITTAANLTGSYGFSQNPRPNSTGQSAKLSGPAQERLGRWFNTSVFTQPAAFSFGNVGRNLPDTRGHNINNIDLSIFKNTYFGPEARFNVQFRAEFYNLFNRVHFALPGRSLGTPQFGVVNAQANEPRLIQMALKLIF